MLFEVLIPPQQAGEGVGRTLVVDAPNWLVALREAIAEVGLDPQLERRSQCEIRADQSVTVTDRGGQQVHLRLLAHLPEHGWADEEERSPRLKPRQKAGGRAEVIARCSTEELDQIVSQVLSQEGELAMAEDLAEVVARDLDGMAALGSDADRASNLALEVALRHVPSRSGWVLLRVGEVLVVQAARGSRAATALDRRLPRGAGLAWHCVESGQGTAVSEAANNPLVQAGLPAAVGLSPSSVACVPVPGPAGVRGVIQLVDRSQADHFSGTDLLLLSTVADRLGGVLG